MENEKHNGGCGCGKVRYETTGHPVRAGICHCRYCQTRTGSAFGISVYFEESQVNIIKGDLTEYNFNNSSGRNFKKYCKERGPIFWIHPAPICSLSWMVWCGNSGRTKGKVQLVLFVLESNANRINWNLPFSCPVGPHHPREWRDWGGTGGGSKVTKFDTSIEKL